MRHRPFRCALQPGAGGAAGGHRGGRKGPKEAVWSTEIFTASSGMNFGSVVMMVLPAADCGSSSVARSRRASLSMLGSTRVAQGGRCCPWPVPLSGRFGGDPLGHRQTIQHKYRQDGHHHPRLLVFDVPQSAGDDISGAGAHRKIHLYQAVYGSDGASLYGGILREGKDCG